MIKIIYNEDIALSNADIIVNASNGIGWMGGQACINKRHKGVAESIQYISKGEVEKLSKAACKGKIFGFAPGSIFVTDASNLNAKYIIHAVTMRFPGSKAHIKTIEKLVPKILKTVEYMHIETIAIPLLGCGTGRLPEREVFEIYEKYFEKSTKIFYVYKGELNW